MRQAFSPERTRSRRPVDGVGAPRLAEMLQAIAQAGAGPDERARVDLQRLARHADVVLKG